MTVSATAARIRAEPATVGRGEVDLRRGSRVLGGSHDYQGQRLVTGWHSHDVHQVEYAVSGVVEVETADAHYLVPPQQAVWIPAGLEHQATMSPEVRTVSALFDPSLLPHPGDRARVIAVSPLIREMLLHGLRWPIDRLAGCEVSDSFFRTLGHAVVEALDHSTPLSLPNTTNPVVAAAMAYTKDHLDSVTAAEVSRAVAVSERTLRREFQTTLGRSWRDYLQHARMLRAMAMLAAPGPSVRIVASAVGFDSVSSFSRAFAQHCGETPTAYRQHASAEVRARPVAPARPHRLDARHGQPGTGPR
jgi:AraC-like DNA-binding protein/mannose-6-phosphate isomerase-like protein (cupin superfamily)